MPRSLRALLLIVLSAVTWAPPAHAQLDNPVYVDDSPQAWELFRQARDQQRSNMGETVRLSQELLDDFGFKLIPVSESATDQFQSVRLRVLESIAANEDLLARYRLIQTAPAEDLLQRGELERLALTRSLTEPGLDALLMLAQRCMESARFDAATAWLDEAMTHPDLAGKRAAAAHYMRGFIAHARGDAPTLTEERTQLTLLGAQADAHRLALEQLQPDDRIVPVPVITSLDRSHAGQLNDLVAQAIWSVPLEDSLLRRRFAGSIDPDQPSREPRGRMPDLTTAAATVVGPNVYINEGHTILALNLLTGRQVWQYTDTGGIGGLPDRDNQEALDLSMIAVHGRSLVTLTGHAMGVTRGDGGKILCLDTENGSLRWPPITLDQAVGAGPDEDAFPHGAPIIAEGVIYIIARKVSAQMLTSAYIVAIDLDDGRVLWSRHITSSGGLQRGSRPFCSLVHDHGSLYIASAVGATAKLDASTGLTRWLHRFNVPIAPSVIDQSRRPWEMTGPALTSRGVLVIQPDSRRIILLDNASGDLLESHSCISSSDWNSPRYLLANDQYVYAIGNEVRAFRIDDLERPVWRLPAPLGLTSDAGKGPGSAATAPPTPGPAAPPVIDIRGRVQLLDDALVVPTTSGILLVDSTTGHIANTLAIESTGNPLAIDSQLLLASGDRLDSYMSFEHAQTMLRQRIAQSPNEPEPALSLVRLAMRVRNLALALEAADLSLNAINQLAAADPGSRRARETRDELFSMLLEIAASKTASTPEEGERLFAVISGVAIEPDQRVRHLLAYGDWLADHALTKAVEAWQAILSDSLLAQTWHIDRDTMRPAAQFAAQRLAAVIAAQGKSAYAPQADFAARRLQQLAGAQPPDSAALNALAAEFPFAPAAIDAALQSAAIDQRRGDPRAAMVSLLRVHSLAPRAETTARLLAAAAALAQETGWTSQARQILGLIARTDPSLALLTPNAKRTATEWLATLPSSESPRLPRLGIQPGVAEPLPGILVPAYEPEFVGLPLDRVLLREQKTLSLIAADGLKPIWENKPLDGEFPQLLRFDPASDDLLLWFGSDQQDPKATMLKAGTGELRWRTPRLADIIADPVRDLARNRGVRDPMPNGDLFEPQQTMPLLSDRALILIQRTGGMAALDLRDGKTPLWTRKQSLEQVHFAILTDSILAIAGMAREVAGGANAAGGDLSPRILLIDPQTGLTLGDPIRPLGRTGVKWMRATPLGMLVYGTSDGIDAIDLFTGHRQFATTAYEAIESQRAWQIDGRLIIEDARSRLHLLDVSRGTLSEAFESPLRGEWNPQDLRDCVAVGNRIAVCYPQRIVIYNPADGAIVGNDVIGDDRDFRWLLPTAEKRLVLVNNKGVSQVADNVNPGLRTQYNYTLFTLSDNAKILAGPLGPIELPDRINNALLLDGWLVLSTGTASLAIPMKPEP